MHTAPASLGRLPRLLSRASGLSQAGRDGTLWGLSTVLWRGALLGVLQSKPCAGEEVQLPALGLGCRCLQRAADGCLGREVQVQARAEVCGAGRCSVSPGLCLAWSWGTSAGSSWLSLGRQSMLVCGWDRARQQQDSQHGLQVVALVQHTAVPEDLHV